MFKNRILQLMLIILIAITLIVGALFFFIFYLNREDDPFAGEGIHTETVRKPASQVRDSTVFIEDVLANLAENEGVVKISFAFEMENEEAKAEMELLNFKVQDIINQTLMETRQKDLQTVQGLDELKTKLLNRINPILSEGKLLNVFITNKVVQ